MNLLQQIETTTKHIQDRIGDFRPEYGIILGTGLGALVNDVNILHTLEYRGIPNFPIATVESHSGKLIFGTLAGKNIVVMQGRFHYYEGYTMTEVTFGVRVLKNLGIQTLIISNAAGGLNDKMIKSDVMIITDHINMQPDNPLRGRHFVEFGSRFPDVSACYNAALIEKALQIAQKNNIVCHTGVYVSVSGPSLETPAEYKFLRLIGADAVGMSTVPEVIVATQMQLPVFAISCITDEAFPKHPEPVTIASVLAAAAIAEPKMTTIIKKLLEQL
jgi:purine-nucleoside phosphorylase